MLIYIYAYIFIYTYMHLYIYVTGTKTGLETKRQHYILLVKMVNWRGCWQVHRQLSVDHLCMCSGFPTKMMEQTIVMSFNDVTRITHA